MLGLSTNLRVKLVAFGLLAAFGAAPAKANLVFQSATFTGVDTGEYIVTADRYLGVEFTLTETTQITGIGGQFGGYPSGTIFGAIVPVDPSTSLPSILPSQVESESLAHVVFPVTGTAPVLVDLIEPLKLTLAAGTYGVVFGSGLFGADGWAGLGDGNATVGSPNFSNYADYDGDVWTNPYADGVRIVVDGVPEPSTWAMMLIGLAGLGFAARRSTRGGRVAAAV